jgi:hypothetical protein
MIPLFALPPAHRAARQQGHSLAQSLGKESHFAVALANQFRATEVDSARAVPPFPCFSARSCACCGLLAQMNVNWQTLS